MSPEEQLDFYHKVLKHSEITYDWWAISADYCEVPKPTRGQKDATQQKFKKLIESTNKYGLVNGKVVDLGENTDAVVKAPAKKGGRPKGPATPRTPAGRKRKTKDVSEDEESEDEESTPAKKTKRTPRAAAKKTFKKEVTPSDEEDDAEEATPAANGDDTAASAPVNKSEADDDSDKEAGD